jgi:hypothetical protein
MVAAGSDHDHRKEPGSRVCAQSSANLITVHLGHHDVQQYEVRILAAGLGQSLETRSGWENRVPARGKDGVEEPDVLG